MKDVNLRKRVRRLRIRILLPCLVLATTQALSASELRLQGGEFRVGGRLAATHVNVGAAAVLGGNGTIDAPATIAGAVAPGSASGMDVDTLTFTTSLTFIAGSVYVCYAETHFRLDLIVAGGPVSGEGQVRMSKASGAIPLDQVIIDGDAASLYAAVSATDPAGWELSTAAPGDLLVTDLVGDSDGDGVPDYWEADHFGGRTNCSPSVDTDGDAMDDGSEFVALTDPHDTASTFAAAAIEVSGSNTIVVTWNSASNRVYAIDRITNLADGVTTNLAVNLPGAPPENTYTDVVGVAEAYFYRIKVSIP